MTDTNVRGPTRIEDSSDYQSTLQRSGSLPHVTPNGLGVVGAWDSFLRPLTHMVRMRTDPAAARKSPSQAGPRPSLGLSVGLRAWVFLTEDPPPQTP